MEIFLLMLKMFFALFVGGLFLLIAAGLISSQARENKVTALESENATRRMARNAELIRLLYEIGRPDLPSGHYSEVKMALWKIYFEKEEIHKRLTREEHLAEIWGVAPLPSSPPAARFAPASPQIADERRNLGGVGEEVFDVQ